MPAYNGVRWQKLVNPVCEDYLLLTNSHGADF